MTGYAKLKLEMALSTNPLATSPTWTDITSKLESGRVTRRKGRASDAQFVLDNLDDAFNRWNTSSPYYPNLKPMKKIRLSASWNLMTVNAASIETGTAGTWFAGTNTTIAQSSAQALDGTKSLELTATAGGDMDANLAGGTDGVAVDGGITHSFVASFRAATVGRSVRIRVHWHNTAGVFHSTTTGDTVTDTTTGWTQATLQVAPPVDGYAQVEVYVVGAGAGEVHYVDCVGVFPASGITTWSAGGPHRIFTGFVEDIGGEWENVKYGKTVITAIDGCKVLTLVKPVKTTYYDAVMADTPVGYWRLGEQNSSATASAGDGSIHVSAQDATANNYDAMYFGSPTFGQLPAIPTEADTCVDLGDREAYILLPGVTPATGTGDFTVEGWVYCRSYPTVDFADRIWSMQLTASHQVHLYIRQNGTLRFTVSDGTDGGYIESSSALPTHEWVHVVAVKSGTAGPSAWRIYLNNANASTGATTIGSGSPNLTAYTTMIGGKDVAGVGTPAFDGLVDEVALYNSALSAARVDAHYDAAYGLPFESLAGARLGNVLDLITWPSADRSIDAGQFVMQRVKEPLYDTPPFEYITRLVESEGWPAAWFINGAGEFVFQDRAHATPSSSATFSDNSATLYYDAGPAPACSESGIWTRVVLQAEDGKPQTATDTSAGDEFCPRTLTRTGLLNASDADVATMASSELTRWKTAKDHLERLVIDPTDEPATMWPQVLAREINDRVAAERTSFPGGGDSFTLDSRIDTAEHTFGGDEWLTVWTLQPT